MTILIWPHALLVPASISANPVPFTRSGGRSLGGLERSTRTDRGWWTIDYKGVPLFDVTRRRVWNGIRVSLLGTAGQIAIPVWSFDTAPWLPGSKHGFVLTSHSDDTSFSDGSDYSQPYTIVEMATAAALGATSVTLRIVAGIEELTGTRFSYRHAFYELGLPTLVDGNLWTLPIFPAIRAPIPIDVRLNFAMPTCLVRLAKDNGMDVVLSTGSFDLMNVSFVEDVAYWNSLASA